MTKREFFNQVIAIATNEEMVAIAKHEIELLDKKASKASEKKSTANEAVYAIIIDALASMDKGVTSTELVKGSPALGEYSVQRVTAMLTKLVEAGRVEKTVEKRKSYYRLADSPSEAEDSAPIEAE